MQNQQCPECKRRFPCIQQHAIKLALEKHIKNEILLDILYIELGMKNNSTNKNKGEPHGTNK